MSAIELSIVTEQAPSEAPVAVEQPTPLSAVMEAIQTADLSYQDTFNLGMYLLNSVSKNVLPNKKLKPFTTPALKAALLTGSAEAPKKRGRPPKASKEALDEAKESGKTAAAAITAAAAANEGVKKPRGRPPMSEEEKARRKAERLALKATTTTTVMENADMEELATELEKDLNISSEAPVVADTVGSATSEVPVGADTVGSAPSEVPAEPTVSATNEAPAKTTTKVRKIVKRATA